MWLFSLTMNKQERKLKQYHRWIRRIKALGYWNKGNPESFTTCFKAQGKPCSCSMCSPHKYSRKHKHKQNYEHTT